MELAAALGAAQPGGLILAAIASVFTIGYLANLLGKDEDWLHELPEDGCLHVYGVGEDGVAAFTEYGIECFGKSSPIKEPLETRRRRSSRQNSLPLRCSPHAYPFGVERHADAVVPDDL